MLHQGDWSDSDEDDLSQLETQVLLGVPDGDVDVEADIIDAAVSRIGGLPAFLPSCEPPLSSSHCKSCNQPMELLLQIWCPFENSPKDRALYVWGCARSGCQGKDGSVRAWRGLRHNDKYAEKLARKRQRQSEREKAKAVLQTVPIITHPSGNPFSMAGGSDKNIPLFGLSAQLFGGTLNTENASHPSDDGNDADEDASDSGSSDDGSLLTALAATTISDSPWRSAPSYPPLYLSTVSEYLPQEPKTRIPKGVVVEDLGDDEKKEKDISWTKETYENSLEVDQVFERFTKRVAYQGEQCVRYELKGTPLPYASDKIFDLLWPTPPQGPLPVTKAAFKVIRPQRRTYDALAVPKCPICYGSRTFECQLMPNLINVLRPSWMEDNKKNSEEERRQLVQKTLKNQDKDLKLGMDWGTCMIFSCENDCCRDKELTKDCWREEVVYIQSDS